MVIYHGRILKKNITKQKNNIQVRPHVTSSIELVISTHLNNISQHGFIFPKDRGESAPKDRHLQAGKVAINMPM